MVKVLKVTEMPAEILDRAKRIHLVDEKTGANNLRMILININPKAPPHVPYHSHKNQESVYFVIQGKGKMLIEDKEYIVEPDMVVFIPPKERHQVFNIGETDLTLIEVFSPPRDD